jgi:hypothetical protein
MENEIKLKMIRTAKDFQNKISIQKQDIESFVNREHNYERTERIKDILLFCEYFNIDVKKGEINE